MGRICCIAGALVALIAVPILCQAQQLKNVSGFDAGLLIGKLCKGTFSTGFQGEEARGAMHLRFIASDGLLVAESRGKLGSDAFRLAAGDPFSTSDEIAREVNNLSVSGSRVTFSTALGSKYDLTYDGGALVG